jgi:hypothetical protein
MHSVVYVLRQPQKSDWLIVGSVLTQVYLFGYTVADHSIAALVLLRFMCYANRKSPTGLLSVAY